MQNKLFTLLSIAGSDPTGGAGIQADIRTGVSLGLHVMTALTAVTVQNSKGLQTLGVVSSNLLKSQLEAVLEECIPSAIKIGMIGSEKNLMVISDFLSKISKKIPVVIDPVFAATANDSNMMGDATPEKWAQLYRDHLFPRATVIVPNKTELEILIRKKNTGEMSYKQIREYLKAENVIITQSHKQNDKIIDLLLYPNDVLGFEHPEIECRNLHGTGCVYSTLVACFLALTDSIFQSFQMANDRMKSIIEKSCDYSLGDSKYGPLDINTYLK